MSSDLTLISPVEDPAMRELFKFVGHWSERHNLGSDQEVRYLAHLLAGRLDVASNLTKLKATLKADDEEEQTLLKQAGLEPDGG